MLSINEQKRIESVVEILEIINHPIEDILSSAKDFLSPSLEIVSLYLKCYTTYSEDEIYELEKCLSEVISIRKILNDDLKKLWFNFDINWLYEWLKNFYTFLWESKHYITSSHYVDIINWNQETEKGGYGLKEMSQGVLNAIQIEINEMKLHSTIEELISQLRSDINNWKENINLNGIIDRLNHTFKSCNLYYGERRSETHEILFIKNDEFLALPSLEKTLYELTIRKWEQSSSLRIHHKLRILFQLLSFISYESESFYTKMNDAKPSAEIFKKLEEDKILYWSKWAYLRFLKSFLASQKALTKKLEIQSKIKSVIKIKESLPEIDNLDEDNIEDVYQGIYNDLSYRNIKGFNFNLLPSMEIDIKLYKSWKNWENINNKIENLYNECVEYFDQENAKDDNGRNKLPKEIEWIMVRSSAVNSEDNKKTSGAGIYESFWDIQSLEHFKEAVVKIFESVDSKKAIAHRKEYWIKEEFMGLVIMPYINSDSPDCLWYVNTSRVGKPHLLDIKDGKWRTITLEKDLIPADLDEMHLSRYVSTLQNIDLDESTGFRISNSGFSKNMELIYFMEKFLKIPLQFEFVSTNDRTSWYGSKDWEVYIVQMRPLNYSDISTKIPTFPSENHIHEWRSVIPWDIIVDYDELKITSSSHQATIRRAMSDSSSLDIISRDLYKAVIIYDWFSTETWHIETLCTEKGIICITNDPTKEDYSEENLWKYKKLRIVSDWEIARVYPIEEY